MYLSHAVMGRDRLRKVAVLFGPGESGSSALAGVKIEKTHRSPSPELGGTRWIRTVSALVTKRGHHDTFLLILNDR